MESSSSSRIRKQLKHTTLAGKYNNLRTLLTVHFKKKTPLESYSNHPRREAFCRISTLMKSGRKSTQSKRTWRCKFTTNRSRSFICPSSRKERRWSEKRFKCQSSQACGKRNRMKITSTTSNSSITSERLTSSEITRLARRVIVVRKNATWRQSLAFQSYRNARPNPNKS